MTGAAIFPKGRFTLPMLMQAICFGLHFFAFQLTEFTINDRTEALLGAEQVNAVYAIGIACTALGFLSFSVLRKLFPRERVRKTVLCAVGALSLLSSILVVAVSAPGLFIASAFLALLSFGHIGGCVYYNMAMTFQGSVYTGRVVGLSAGIAVLLQFFIQNLFATEIGFVAGIALSVALLVWFAIKPPRDWMFENPLPFSAENKTEKKLAVTLVAAVALMSLVVALIDGVVVSLHAFGQTSVTSYVRLFYGAGLIAAGLAADVKQRRYLSLFTVCFMFISTVSNAFLANSNTYFWCIAFMYLYCGFYVVFMTVVFMDFAPQTANPALWAGMGRVIRSVIVALTAIPTVWLFRVLGTTALIAGSCLFSIAILLLLLKDIGSAILPAKSPEIITSKPTSEEKLAFFAQAYAFTPREAEVFEALMTGDDGVQEIADRLLLSRRVLQRYISSIYEKTGTKSRIGLFQLFMNGSEGAL